LPSIWFMSTFKFKFEMEHNWDVFLPLLCFRKKGNCSSISVAFFVPNFQLIILFWHSKVT
jgi:hypothetical protein